MLEHNMRAIVTCGAGSEPIDEVRFLTNFSTGELGALLAKKLHDAGFEVICLRSRLATYPIDDSLFKIIPFTTNADLATALEELSEQRPVAAVFHAAALCDYRVKKITTKNDAPLFFGKIPTHLGELTMTLEPTIKVIAQLRSWFPKSFLVGWKYEVDGTRETALAKARQQIRKYKLDACVANGPLFKNSFDFISVRGETQSLDSKSALASFLSTWVKAFQG